MKFADLLTTRATEHETCDDETCVICIDRERKAARALQSPSMRTVMDRLRNLADGGEAS